jgi:hypothetical protein
MLSIELKTLKASCLHEQMNNTIVSNGYIDEDGKNGRAIESDHRPPTKITDLHMKSSFHPQHA